MSAVYSDPQDFAIHVGVPLLAQYLASYGVTFAADNKDDESAEEKTQRFLDFVEANLKQSDRDKVLSEFSYINGLSSRDHILALCDYAPEIDKDRLDSECSTYDEKALWVFLNYRQKFDDYYTEAETKYVSGLKYVRLPKAVAVADVLQKTKLEAFKDNVQQLYQKRLKGSNATLYHWQVNDDLLMLRVYLEDLPTREKEFSNGKLDNNKARKPVFDVYVVYNSKYKSLGVKARDGKDYIFGVQQAFSSVFLSEDKFMPDDTCYKLPTCDELNDFSLEPTPGNGIERAWVKSVFLKNPTNFEQLVINFNNRNSLNGTTHASKRIQGMGITGHNWSVVGIDIAFLFAKSGPGRQKRVTASIRPPNGCNVRYRPQDLAVHQQLQDWGIRL